MGSRIGPYRAKQGWGQVQMPRLFLFDFLWVAPSCTQCGQQGLGLQAGHFLTLTVPLLCVVH